MSAGIPIKKYKSAIIYNRQMIAPCGMNCGTCIAFMRPKNTCPGCLEDSSCKNKSCVNCIIRNCDRLAGTTSGFCYECNVYPCLRLRKLNKRYRTRYNTSFLENLKIIKEEGVECFLLLEKKRRTCPDCGSSLSVHRSTCLFCS